MEKFKVGDVVQLKSGGPNMTISGFFGEQNNVSCVWFTKSSDGCEEPKQSSVFTTEMIEHFD